MMHLSRQHRVRLVHVFKSRGPFRALFLSCDSFSAIDTVNSVLPALELFALGFLCALSSAARFILCTGHPESARGPGGVWDAISTYVTLQESFVTGALS
jgi:hypothetical protein